MTDAQFEIQGNTIAVYCGRMRFDFDHGGLQGLLNAVLRGDTEPGIWTGKLGVLQEAMRLLDEAIGAEAAS